MELSLENEFRQRQFEMQVKMMSEEQKTEFLIKLHYHYLVMQTQYKELLKSAWGL